MTRLTATIFILLLMTLAASPCSAHSTIIFLETDLDGDGQVEQIRLDKERDPTVSILHGKRVMWRGVPALWRPWKLSVADVDNDGHKEIIVGVYKQTRFFPKLHNCLFIYSWDGQRAHPKWLGSSLSKPFLDFAFVDEENTGRVHLLAIEKLRDGKLCLAAYSWNGFGFTLDWQRGAWLEARIIETARDRLTLEADGERLIFRSDEMRSKS